MCVVYRCMCYLQVHVLFTGMHYLQVMYFVYRYVCYLQACVICVCYLQVYVLFAGMYVIAGMCVICRCVCYLQACVLCTGVYAMKWLGNCGSHAHPVNDDSGAGPRWWEGKVQWSVQAGILLCLLYVLLLYCYIAFIFNKMALALPSPVWDIYKCWFHIHFFIKRRNLGPLVPRLLGVFWPAAPEPTPVRFTRYTCSSSVFKFAEVLRLILAIGFSHTALSPWAVFPCSGESQKNTLKVVGHFPLLVKP